MDNLLQGVSLAQGRKLMVRSSFVPLCVLIDTMGSGSLMGMEAVLIMLVREHYQWQGLQTIHGPIHTVQTVPLMPKIAAWSMTEDHCS